MTDLIERLRKHYGIGHPLINEAIAALEAPLPDDVQEAKAQLNEAANRFDSYGQYSARDECLGIAHMLERLARENASMKLKLKIKPESYEKEIADLEQRIEELEAALADLWDYVENMESEHNTPHVGLFMSTKPEHREIIETSTKKARAGE